MATRLTTYLCNEKLLATEETSLGSNAISVSSGKVTAKIIQESASCIPDGVVLTNKIIQKYRSKYLNLTGTGMVRLIESSTVKGNLVITYLNPAHCHWIQTVLWVGGHNNTDQPMVLPFNLIQISLAPHIGPIPESKSEAMLGGYESVANVKAYWGDEDYVSSSSDIVPGDLVAATWYFYDGSKVESVFSGWAYFSTFDLTGGKVVSVNGTPGSIDVSYTVNIESYNEICYSSDFVEYEVDDWVVVQRNGNIMLPLKIGAFAN